MLEHRLNSQRIVVARDICHGKPRVAGTRIMVYWTYWLVVKVLTKSGRMNISLN